MTRTMHKRAAAALLLGVSITASGAAFAQQDLHQIVPKQPQPNTPATVTPPPQPAAPAPAQNQALLPSLKGLTLTADANRIVRKGIDAPGIAVDPALPILADARFRAELEPFLGQPFGTATIPAVTRLIVDWYRAHNHPVVDVLFPEQDISRGTVQVLVVEYRVGKVTVEGNTWFSSGLVRDSLLLQSGDTIDFSQLRTNLNGMNRNPFRRVDLVFARSDTPGDTDIVLKTQDRLPLRVYASYDDDGLPATGRDQYSLGFNWGNVFDTDGQFSYQFTTSADIFSARHRGIGQSDDPRLMAHAVDYIAPLPWGDVVHVYGSYLQQVPNVGPNFGQVGRNSQISVRYERPLDSAIAELTQQIEFGYDHKYSNSNLAFGGIRVFANATDVDQFALSYEGTLIDGWGQTALENDLVYSPGGLTGGNNDAAFQASGVAGSHANYLYNRLSLTRLTNLPYAMSWEAKLVGQLASTDLILSEALGAGGIQSVRGYDERAESGSQGVLISNELYSPIYSPLRVLTGRDINDQGQLLVFWDYGHVAYQHLQTNTPTSAELSSVGFGARYNVDRYLDARFDYGWQLERVPGAARLGRLATVVVTVSY